MPVKRLRDRNARVHDPVSANKPVANVRRLRLVVEKTEKAGQDQGLADGKREKGKPWDNDREQSRAQGNDTAKDEAMLARLSLGRCWIKGGIPPELVKMGSTKLQLHGASTNLIYNCFVFCIVFFTTI